MIAAGLHGIENELSLEDEFAATPTRRTSRTCRRTCARRKTSSRTSEAARAAFGEEVVEHYLNMARVEIEAFEAAVTDWERYRTFERL